MTSHNRSIIIRLFRRLPLINITVDLENFLIFSSVCINSFLITKISYIILGLNRYVFYYSTFVASLIIILFFIKNFYFFYKKQNYKALIKRFALCFFIGLILVDIGYIPYLYKNQVFANSQPIEIQMLPITELQIARSGYRDKVWTKFKGSSISVNINGQQVVDIERDGKYNYCVFLGLQKAIDDFYFVNYSYVERCY